MTLSSIKKKNTAGREIKVKIAREVINKLKSVIGTKASLK